MDHVQLFLVSTDTIAISEGALTAGLAIVIGSISALHPWLCMSADGQAAGTRVGGLLSVESHVPSLRSVQGLGVCNLYLLAT